MYRPRVDEATSRLCRLWGLWLPWLAISYLGWGGWWAFNKWRLVTAKHHFTVQILLLSHRIVSLLCILLGGVCRGLFVVIIVCRGGHSPLLLWTFRCGLRKRKPLSINGPWGGVGSFLQMTDKSYSWGWMTSRKKVCVFTFNKYIVYRSHGLFHMSGDCCFSMTTRHPMVGVWGSLIAVCDATMNKQQRRVGCLVSCGWATDGRRDFANHLSPVNTKQIL